MPLKLGYYTEIQYRKKRLSPKNESLSTKH